MDATSGGQPLLFDDLPEAVSAVRRKPRRVRTAAEPVAVDRVSEPAPPMPPPAPPPRPMAAPVVQTQPAPAPLDPAALTNPELRALVRGLNDLRLSYLLVEAARELKQRVQPDVDEDGVVSDPNPSLLRAARLTVADLSGEDD
ncbi:hypothetical protein [Azospirillum sp. TSO22-1]|uniref:hypothetical protein n=1 Tax=Azospirillum sp. TSO22-1 TaxID=716789 RepID=UPI000D60B194|nr:hypothetical protein [Azospirillum sp. TSO22-1]PWC30958.1 hypothetical protein TSO221_34085 [Azospirillum sp. TSO22-1]